MMMCSNNGSGHHPGVVCTDRGDEIPVEFLPTQSSLPGYDSVNYRDDMDSISPSYSQDYEEPANQDPCDSYSFPYVDFTQIDFARNSFITLYIVTIFFSLLGNYMVIYTVWKKKHMRTITNYYILNLSIADFLIALFVMPLKLLEYAAPCSWNIFNRQAVCPFLHFISPVFVFTSVLTLVAISLERYYAVVHPLSAIKLHSKSRTKKVIAATWIVPLVLATPYLFSKSYPFSIHSQYGSLSRQICTDRFDDIDRALYGEDSPTGRFRRGFFMFLFIFVYLIPMVVIAGTCINMSIALLKPVQDHDENDEGSKQGRRITRKREENKRKVARMIIFVAVAFATAWTPFYMVSFVSQVQTGIQNTSFLQRSNFLFTMLLTHLFGFLNSCVNPLIYTAMSDRFRRNFKQIIVRFCCCICRQWLHRRERRRYFDCEYREGTAGQAFDMYRLRKFTMIGTSKSSNSRSNTQIRNAPEAVMPDMMQNETPNGELAQTRNTRTDTLTVNGQSHGCRFLEKGLRKSSRSFPTKLECFSDCEFISLVMAKRGHSSPQYASVKLKRHSSSPDNSGCTGGPLRNGTQTSTFPADSGYSAPRYMHYETKESYTHARSAIESDSILYPNCSFRSDTNFSVQSEICREILDSRPLARKYRSEINTRHPHDHILPNLQLHHSQPLCS